MSFSNYVFTMFMSVILTQISTIYTGIFTHASSEIITELIQRAFAFVLAQAPKIIYWTQTRTVQAIKTWFTFWKKKTLYEKKNLSDN